MTKRIIEIGSEGCYLHIQNKQLVIERERTPIGSTPVEDLSALIIDHPRTLITQACLRELVKANVMVITADERHQPVGLLLPLESNTLQAERFSAQAALSKPAKKALWKQIVVSKVRHQARVLKMFTGKDAGLTPLSKKVRSGDPDNIEAQAARRYWSRLFPEGDFKRRREAEDQNRFLNYGYAVLRALVGRNLCAAGLHPSLGIHHHNRYNAYCLADDLMEPYRPFVDHRVKRVVERHGGEKEMDREIRKELLEIVGEPVTMESEQLTFQGAIQKSAQSLAKIVDGAEKTLLLPDA